MAPFVPFPDGYEAQVIFTFGGEIVENTLWFFDRFGPADSTKLQELADGIAAWHQALILPYLSDQLTLVAIEVHDWSVEPRPIVAVSNPNVTGANTTKPYSANISVRVPFRWPSNRHARQNSNFLPGIPDDAVVINDVVPAFADAMFEGYAALIDAAAAFSPGNDWRWVVTSRRVDNAPREEMYFGSCIGPTPAVTYKVTTRRKRLPPPPP